jgi:hypothetical protein
MILNQSAVHVINVTLHVQDILSRTVSKVNWKSRRRFNDSTSALQSFAASPFKLNISAVQDNLK